MVSGAVLFQIYLAVLDGKSTEFRMRDPCPRTPPSVTVDQTRLQKEENQNHSEHVRTRRLKGRE